MSSALNIQKLSKSFGELEILAGLNLSLASGESAAIVGPSGAGKSTLLHISGLMERPSSGDVFIEDKNTNELSEIQRAKLRLDSIGFLFQFHHLLPDFSVLENTLIPLRLAGDNITEGKEKAIHILSRLGLKERLSHRPKQLSGGEQQRAALARALIRRPKILLCDEPTGNLDQKTAQEVTALIFSEIKENDLAAIIVTHNQEIAKQAGIIYQLSNGALEKTKVMV